MTFIVKNYYGQNIKLYSCTFINNQKVFCIPSLEIKLFDDLFFAVQ